MNPRWRRSALASPFAPGWVAPNRASSSYTSTPITRAAARFSSLDSRIASPTTTLAPIRVAIFTPRTSRSRRFSIEATTARTREGSNTSRRSVYAAGSRSKRRTSRRNVDGTPPTSTRRRRPRRSSVLPFVDDGDGTTNTRRLEARVLPFDAHRIARVLTLSPSEVDAVSDWDDDDAGAYDGAQPFGASHERRTLAALVDVVRGELARYESTRGDVSATTPEEDDAILRALMNESGGETTTPGWIADRPEVAGCVETVVAGGSFAAERDEAARAARWRRRAIAAVTTRRGEKLLLAEIAKDLEARARAA